MNCLFYLEWRKLLDPTGDWIQSGLLKLKIMQMIFKFIVRMFIGVLQCSGLQWFLNIGHANIDKTTFSNLHSSIYLLFICYLSIVLCCTTHQLLKSKSWINARKRQWSAPSTGFDDKTIWPKRCIIPTSTNRSSCASITCFFCFCFFLMLPGLCHCFWCPVLKLLFLL